MSWKRSQSKNCLCDGEGRWVVDISSSAGDQHLRGMASGDGRYAGDTCREEPNGSERLPVLLLVLLLSAEIPPERQKGHEIVAKSPCWTSPCRMSHVGQAHVGCPIWDGMYSAHSVWGGVLGSINQSPTQRTESSRDLGANPAISIQSCEFSLRCFLVDAPVKPAFAMNKFPGRHLSECPRHTHLTPLH